MLVITSKVKVPGLTGHDVSDFMMSCTDEQYRQWWPGTHLQLHVLDGDTGGEGDVMVMDEFVGRRRLRLRGVVEALEPGRRIVWRLHKIVPLPARVSLVFSPTQDGVCVQHTVTAGWPGIGRALETGNPNHALKWIDADHEGELLGIFSLDALVPAERLRQLEAPLATVLWVDLIHSCRFPVSADGVVDSGIEMVCAKP
ncbi:MAG: hypothetical protein JWR71_518 [Pseudarthrobacter sp.]|nr:hypothetical protein [Pseudarthrobacter sp.]